MERENRLWAVEGEFPCHSSARRTTKRKLQRAAQEIAQLKARLVGVRRFCLNIASDALEEGNTEGYQEALKIIVTSAALSEEWGQ